MFAAINLKNTLCRVIKKRVAAVKKLKIKSLQYKIFVKFYILLLFYKKIIIS